MENDNKKLSNELFNERIEDDYDHNNKSEDTEIAMQSHPSNRHRKKVKVKAWCSQCFQFFANGPFSKVCQQHYDKKCNIVSCQKALNLNDCVRMFSNVNSENRHTHCLKRSEVQNWNKDCEIRNCLGLKRDHEGKIDEVMCKEKENDKSWGMTTNNMGGLIDQIGHLNFNEDDFEFNNLFNLSGNMYNDENKNIQKICKAKDEKKDNDKEEDKKKDEIRENEMIEEFFNRIQKETSISTFVKKKLIKAFKSKGILNVKTLKLYLNKNRSSDFLIDKFKSVTSQIEGVALCIEYLLKDRN